MWSSDLKEIDAYLSQAERLLTIGANIKAARAVTNAIFLQRRYFERMNQTYGNDFGGNLKELAEILNSISRLSLAVMDVGMSPKDRITLCGRQKDHTPGTPD